jgi:hypothetical protein
MVNESFKLGPYAVKDVDRDWDTSSSFAVGSLSKKNTEGGYEYKLVGKGKKFVGQRASWFDDWPIGANPRAGSCLLMVGSGS